MNTSTTTDSDLPADRHPTDTAPGDAPAGRDDIARGIWGYVIGLGLASALTIVSFLMVGTHLVWAPSIPVALTVLAIAQMGVHLVFFLHITSGPDNTNNVMALAFGVLIVMLIMIGSLWIMSHMNHNMMPMDKIMDMQR
jgi:cytochrome o ubiquinol oxidase subunit IV